MGWGTDFTASIYLDRLAFNSKYEVKDAIEDLEKELINNKRIVSMMAIANPETLLHNPDGDTLDPIYGIDSRCTELVDSIIENSILLDHLKLYLEYLENEEVNTESKV